MSSPAHDPDDRLCEFLADRVISIVADSYPRADAVFRRRVARLLLSQLLGRERPPGKIPMSHVARRLRISQQQASSLQASAMARVRAAWFRNLPPLTDHES